MGRHWLVQDPQSVTVNETPFNSVVVHFTSSEPPLDIESAFAVEDAVANRDPFDTNVSQLFRWGGGSMTICVHGNYAACIPTSPVRVV